MTHAECGVSTRKLCATVRRHDWLRVGRRRPCVGQVGAIWVSMIQCDDTRLQRIRFTRVNVCVCVCVHKFVCAHTHTYTHHTYAHGHSYTIQQNYDIRCRQTFASVASVGSKSFAAPAIASMSIALYLVINPSRGRCADGER